MLGTFSMLGTFWHAGENICSLLCESSGSRSTTGSNLERFLLSADAGAGNFWKSNKTRMIRNWGLSGEYTRPRNFLSEKPGSRTKCNVLTTVCRSWVELARTIGTRALILLLIKFLRWGWKGWKGWKVGRLEGRPNIVAILKILVIPLRLVRPRAAMANGHSHCSSPQPLV